MTHLLPHVLAQHVAWAVPVWIVGTALDVLVLRATRRLVRGKINARRRSA